MSHLELNLNQNICSGQLVGICNSCCWLYVVHKAVRAARHLLHSRIALYCKGDYQVDGIQAIHLDPMLAMSSDLRVPPVKDSQFHGKLCSCCGQNTMYSGWLKYLLHTDRRSCRKSDNLHVLKTGRDSTKLSAWQAGECMGMAFPSLKGFSMHYGWQCEPFSDRNALDCVILHIPRPCRSAPVLGPRHELLLGSPSFLLFLFYETTTEAILLRVRQ